MKYLVRRGWSATIATIRHPELPEGPSDWQGVRVINFCPPANRLTRWSGRVHAMRWRVNRAQRWQQPEVALARLRQQFWTLLDYPLMALSAITNFPDGYRHDVRNVGDELIEYHEREPWSAVLSIYGPFTNHLIARHVSRATKVPWIALIKDFYSAPRWNSEPQSLSQLARNVSKRFYEKRVLRESSLLVPYTSHMAGYLRPLVGDVPIRVLANCYDPEQFLTAEEPKKNGFATVCIGGMPRRGLRLFFAGLKELRQRQVLSPAAFRAIFVGGDVVPVRQHARATGCEDLVEWVPAVRHHEAVTYMQHATCLLLHQREGNLPRRFPEYLASRRPILAFPDEPNAPTSLTLQQYRASVVAANAAEVASTLERWYLAYLTEGALGASVDESVVHSFGADRRAEELEDILHHIPSRHGVAPGS